jgi:hypothetical protein
VIRYRSSAFTLCRGSRATLAPLGLLIGDPDFGPLTRSILAFGEGTVLGLGLACGLMRRPAGAREINGA